MNDLQNSQDKLEPWRLFIVYGLVIGLFFFYAFRLFSLQVLDGPNFLSQAEDNRTVRVSDTTQRGIIYDRNGIVLARNIASYNVTITPAYLPGLLPFGYDEQVPGTIQNVYRRLSALIGVPVSFGTMDEETIKVFSPCQTDLGIKEIVYIADTQAPYRPVRIACNVDQKIAMQVRELSADMPGVGIEVEPIREYPTGYLTAELIGFLGPVPANQPGLLLEDYYREKGFVPGRDKVGYAGVENSLQDILGGQNGERFVEVDVAGRELRNLSEPIKPVPGNNIRLTIDTRLQAAAYTALESEIDIINRWLNETRAISGAVVAMNPKTGEILAMVSYPSYENNRFTRLIPAYYYNQLFEDPAKPLLNKAISGEYPPGSVFKMPIAIGALNERVVAPEYTVDDPGKIIIEEKALPNSIGRPREYVCYDEFGHGNVNWLRGVALSCDVYFYKIGGGYRDQVAGNGLGIWRLVEYSLALGYGTLTGVELPGEQNGLIPNPDWKRINQGETWTTGDTYIASMGQGLILSTPLQVLVSANILANDGKYMRPTIVREILDIEGNAVKPFEPVLRWDITKDPVISVFDENSILTGEKRTVEPWVVEMAKQGMREVVINGTATKTFAGSPVESAGKTGTAEYCDDVALANDRCVPGSWPTHSWYFGYAPYDNPEIAVVSFVYNGGEGATLSGWVVKRIIEAYFTLKAIDAETGGPQSVQ
jgi:penicillin-binding protein 2